MQNFCDYYLHMEEIPKNITPTTPTNRFTKIYLTLWAICVLVGFVAFIMYKQGFRLIKGFETVRVGSVLLSSNEKDLQIFLDNRERKAIVRGDKIIISNIIPGTHTLLVSKAGFWPWTKIVEISSNQSRDAFAFLFPMAGVTLEKIANTSTEYKDIKNQLGVLKLPLTYNPVNEETGALPQAEWVKENVLNPIFSSDKNSALFVGDNTIYISWVADENPPAQFCDKEACQRIFPVTFSTSPVKSVSFFKDRSDIVLFSAGNSIYAIEADHKGTQNFEPIFRGLDPIFTTLPDGTIYVKDGETIFKEKL